MRHAITVVCAVAAASGLTYWVTRPAPVNLTSAKSENQVKTEPHKVDARVADALQRQSRDSQMLRSDQTGLRAEIAALGARIDDVESVAKKPEPTNPTVPKQQTEASVAEWLDDTLPREWDAERTRNVTSTLTTLLKSAEGVHLSTAECGSRFCKAVLTTDDGKPPSLASVLGEPSLAQEGFSVRGEDGATTVYFTPPGGSLSSLRSEALADQPPG
jgi:hypothetical protein